MQHLTSSRERTCPPPKEAFNTNVTPPGASGFLSPAQCAYLEDKPSWGWRCFRVQSARSAVYGSGTTRVVSIFLQSIGLNKVRQRNSHAFEMAESFYYIFYLLLSILLGSS